MRLRGNDYTQGAYFVTLCTDPRVDRFGHIVGEAADARIVLSDAGRIVAECWNAIPEHFPHVRLDQMQIMPDHVHGILVFDRHSLPEHVKAATLKWLASTRPNGPRPGSLGAVIGAFKSVTAKRINGFHGTQGRRIWQLDFHERQIRRQGGEFARIADYIAANPAQWR
jgi:putative transposase